MLLAPFVKERIVRYLSVPRAEDLAVLAGFLESGRVAPVIDRTYTLEHVPDAMEHLCAGHARGKVVIRIDS
jgi:NADPH:quinone reductase-like Zn-dependent oxidoreductase